MRREAALKILEQNASEGWLKLRAESLDDLWHLSHVVDKGDVVVGTAYREPEEARAASEKGKVAKRPMTLGVRVEEVEFHESTNRLRILGPIVEGAQDVGMYHTLNVEPFSEIGIRKGAWRDHHLARVKEAVEAAKRPQVVFLAIEDNEAVVAALRQYGVTRIAEVFGHASGKQYAPSKGAEEDFFEEVLMALRDYRPENAPLIVLGPGFAKERFVKFAREKQRAEAKGAVIEPTGQAGMTGVHEAIRRGVVDRVQEGARVSLETRLVEELLVGIATDGPVAFGRKECEALLDLGAVETLLVTDDVLREGDALLERAKGTGATAHVISTRHEAGHKLKNLGGVGALLRYKPAR